MIVWINGPFGVGKTQTAFELHRRLPGSFVLDPEALGFALRKVMPPTLHKSDFQDHALWREFTRQVLEDVAAQFTGPIIVPMTLVVPEYHLEIIGGLRDAGLEVQHFSLMASKSTILKRLRGRLDGPNSWGAQHLERCLRALEAEQFATHIQTDGHPISSTAEAIAAQCGLRLEPSDDHTWSTWTRRLRVSLSHIRR